MLHVELWWLARSRSCRKPRITGLHGFRSELMRIQLGKETRRRGGA
jgi:hypothetical protein